MFELIEKERQRKVEKKTRDNQHHMKPKNDRSLRGRVVVRVWSRQGPRPQPLPSIIMYHSSDSFMGGLHATSATQRVMDQMWTSDEPGVQLSEIYPSFQSRVSKGMCECDWTIITNPHEGTEVGSKSIRRSSSATWQSHRSSFSQALLPKRAKQCPVKRRGLPLLPELLL